MKPLETLRALGTGGEAPSEAKQRVYGALMASVAAAAAATTAATVVKSGTLPPAPTPLIAGLTGGKIAAVIVGIWLIGGATGAALYGAIHPQEVRVVYVDRPVLSNGVAAPVTAAAPAPAAPMSSTPLGSVIDASSKRAAVATASSGSALARERALLDLARANAARGEPALVLAQTDQHRLQFHHGQLAEEREALGIRALLSLGRSEEARTRAEAFHLAYPNSFLTPVVDSALSAP